MRTLQVWTVGAATGLTICACRAQCPADCDGSGELDIFDFLCFQTAFALGEPSADCDGSGALDVFDFLCFQTEFAIGCLEITEFGAAAPPAAPCGMTLQEFPYESRPWLMDVTTVAAPSGAQLSFDIPCNIRFAPIVRGWHGYMGAVYWTNGAPSLEMIVPANEAFQFYVQPNPLGGYDFEITAMAGRQIVSVVVAAVTLDGAVGIGVCGGVEAITIRAVDEVTDFAVGWFAIAE